jgi:hypothetical protein
MTDRVRDERERVQGQPEDVRGVRVGFPDLHRGHEELVRDE